MYQVRPIGMGWARFEPVVTGAATHNAFSDLIFFFLRSDVLLCCCYSVLSARSLTAFVAGPVGVHVLAQMSQPQFPTARRPCGNAVITRLQQIISIYQIITCCAKI